MGADDQRIIEGAFDITFESADTIRLTGDGAESGMGRPVAGNAEVKLSDDDRFVDPLRQRDIADRIKVMIETLCA